MPKLLERPAIVTDSQGRPVLKSELSKREWKTVVTCGQHTGRGCGAKSEIVFDDIFKEVIDNPMMTQIGYRTKCMHCHADIAVPHQDTPWTHEEIPTKVEWLKTYMASLVEQLHEECETHDRARLHKDLLSDGTKLKYLEDFDWS